MVKRTLVVTAGYGGYTRPYRHALGEDYTYISISDAAYVSRIDWDQVYAVVFSGGADICPSFYGRRPLTGTHVSSGHDALDAAVLASIENKPIIKLGTCRGAQLLWAYSEGAQIVQHIPHHFGDHRAHRHQGRMPAMYPGAPGVDMYEDLDAPVDMDINSVHHQACIWDSWESNQSGSRAPVLLMTGESEGQTAVEAWCNADRGNLGFQWHPEWMAEDSVAYQWAQRVIKVFAFGDYAASGSTSGFCTVAAYVHQPDHRRVDLSEEVRAQCLSESRSQ